MRYLFVLLFIFNTGIQAFAVDLSRDAAAIESVDKLLAVDRLQFYVMNLADFLGNKRDPSLIKVLYSITPEDIYKVTSDTKILNAPTNWDAVITAVVNKKAPELKATAADFKWDYNFFKNKLATKFASEPLKAGKGVKPLALDFAEVPWQESPEERVDSKYLMDVERYISEKTTRAFVWDAIINERNISFIIGDQRDFTETVERNGFEIVKEIKPMARNYNKIFLAYNPKTQKHFYMVNLISGADRVLHFVDQIKALKFDGKTFASKKGQVSVYGDANRFHEKQTVILKDIFKNLPVADKVLIGQKGAFETAIKDAGMLDIVKVQSSELLKSMGVDKSAQVSKFNGMAQRAMKESSFQLDALHNSSVKIENVYEKYGDSISRSYAQFTSEQASHEFSDYLLEDTNGQVKRWRVFSAVWGDEIVPIAKALKATGHRDIVYIGTAGAMANKGIKVGDVIRGGFVQTHTGEKLAFTQGNLAPTPQDRMAIVGQVHTPFEETEAWLKKTAAGFDIVEVETGYLREILGSQVKLEAYFLISDVVGSENETLAHAAQSSSRRKRNQLKLLENLFVQNGIRAPISNYEPIPQNARFKALFRKLTELNSSRDAISVFQMTQIAIRNGYTAESDLATLMKQPNFKRADFDFSMKSLGSLLANTQQSLPRGQTMKFSSEDIMNGTFNPKVKSTVYLIAPDGMAMEQFKNFVNPTSLDFMKKYFDIQIVDSNSLAANAGRSVSTLSSDVLFEVYRDVLGKAGFGLEVDISGNYRLKELTGSLGVPRCSSVFM
ncbi:hypothetical protein B9G69_014035 [Bdellovibrio sp. SKB1291214]|uniref:hypothetical protein n=1 Tax=Bdellovibrio sp. SKB1291214 TaxID=1732569 RepID=UPI000B515F23|nr:hypothetical protein [Bdellovibrio sp. SKB1291214]UYL08167.1 hypothetical protein B9G69_014035 [Bdellovibrio sp. SKB1291214]